TVTPLLSSISLWRSWVTHRRKMLKSTGASTHPCLTPVHTGKEADSCPPIVTLAFIPSWNCRRMLTNLLGHPNRSRMSHSRSLCTVSKALERSTTAIKHTYIHTHNASTPHHTPSTPHYTAPHTTTPPPHPTTHLHTPLHHLHTPLHHLHTPPHTSSEQRR